MKLENIKELGNKIFDENDNEDYVEFTEKFKPKRTTDECYTPDNVYKVVADYVAERYGKDKNKFVKPFYPGGDYKKYDYPKGCVVVDNPPFSLIAQIIGWYNDNGIDYFLFAPELTALNLCQKSNILITGQGIIYENSVKASTAFATSMGEYMVEVCPELGKRLRIANKENEKAKHFPKYKYPDNVLSIGKLENLAKYGVDFAIKRENCKFIRALDSQRTAKKSLYGGGLLISNVQAAELRAAELRAAELRNSEEEDVVEWEISEREKEIIKALD